MVFAVGLLAAGITASGGAPKGADMPANRAADAALAAAEKVKAERRVDRMIENDLGQLSSGVPSSEERAAAYR
ncbi:MAG: hypothetical protein FJ096_21490 [Deltaproteobacteria bacterium]|nr:hypothetical protein [Deltaproteobacteria bacterium]